MKYFISADIEGTAGIINWNETEKNHPDHTYFSAQMSREVNAACTAINSTSNENEIFIKDAHDSARNIDPMVIPENAVLFRGWGREPKSMMMGIDESFDGVIFTGYHSPAGTDTNPLSHTMTTKLHKVTINGEIASELLINSLTAAYYNVPVLFVSGDKGLVDWMKSVAPNTEVLATNQGFGDGALAIHPMKAVRLIEEGVKKAMQKPKESLIFPLPKHFDVTIEYKSHSRAKSMSYYPGAKQLNPTTIAYSADDYMDVLTFMHFTM